MCGALWDNEEFLNEQQEFIEEIQGHLEEINHQGYVIIGYVRYPNNRRNGYPLLYNSVAVINQDGYETYDKRILADSDHHEDKKYFANGRETKVFTLHLPEYGKIRIGIPICEDLWYTDHDRNIPGEMVNKLGADMLISINQSYFYYGKQEKRYRLVSEMAKKLHVPIIYCNSVGVGDIVKNILIFDGGSMAVNHLGKPIYLADNFQEESFLLRNSSAEEEFKPKSKYKEICDALIFEQKEFFRLSGIKKAQVHVSGGLDSAIVAALVQKAMGKENTVLITNPTELNAKSEKYVHHITEKLDNPCYVQPLQKIYDTFMEMDSSTMGEELHDTGKASVQAVLRTVQGLAASHRFGSGIVATGNHTEIVLGWASFHDIGSIGVHALIGDLTKLELFELADYINHELYGEEVIPHDIYNGTFKPSAELPDAPGDDPIDYSIYSGICSLLIRERMSVSDISNIWIDISALGKLAKLPDPYVYLDPKYLAKIKDAFPNFKDVLKYSFNEFEAHIIRAQQLLKKSVYKAAQAAPTVLVSKRSRGFSNRETLINHYN
ncbi:MAG: hypothetical protein HC831_08030 [Chloroflexia bacterium]|nr:hypothetical protein [Chloroflexia bacterium]